LSRIYFGTALIVLGWFLQSAVFAAQEKLANVTIAYTSDSERHLNDSRLVEARRRPQGDSGAVRSVEVRRKV
jgi:hypothetical protein